MSNIEEPVYTFTVGDTNALIDLTISKSLTSGVNDLTGDTLSLYAEGYNNGTVVGPLAGTIQGSPSAGICRFDCATMVAAGADRYKCQVLVRNASAKDKRSRDFYLHVKEQIA